MEYRAQSQYRPMPDIAPRLIIHGGAGNITQANLSPERRRAFREALSDILAKTNSYMHTRRKPSSALPTALETATYAVTLLEENPLFNAARGAVFTRDGTNELEASVMVSRGHAKRGVGVAALRRVKSPIQLARAILEHGNEDLGARGCASAQAGGVPDVPSAQGHTLLSGAAAEKLAVRYGLELVDPSYFFTQRRWDEHVRALERERQGRGSASWSATEYLPQGTVGAVALDAEGVVCVATSTGGLTNKLSGRIGDTPVPGAGFWAEEWQDGDDCGAALRLRGLSGPAVVLSDALTGVLATCLPRPYAPVGAGTTVTTRAMAVSGTGNGDSFMRTAAARTVAAMSRFSGVSTREAVTRVAGPNGELQRSAGDRWGKTGEGEGGIIGIECVVTRDAETGRCVEVQSCVVFDFNCGMFRGWIDREGKAHVAIWRKEEEIDPDSVS